MRKTIIATVLSLVLAAVAVSIYSIYSVSAHTSFFTSVNQQKILPYAADARNITCIWKSSRVCKGFRGFEIELSEGFKDKVLNIIKADGDVQRLLSEGYSVSNIKVAKLKLTVQENGQVVIEVSKVVMTLINSGGGKALVEVDLKTGAVTRIVIINMRVIEKATSA